MVGYQLDGGGGNASANLVVVADDAGIPLMMT